MEERLKCKQTYEGRRIGMKANEGSERARRRAMFGKGKTSKQRRTEGSEERSEVKKGRKAEGGRGGRREREEKGIEKGR